MMKKNERVGLALWGVGEHAQRNLLPALEKCEAVEVVGLYTLVQPDAERIAASRGITAYATPEAMLRDPRVDAVYVGTWSAVHAACGRQVLEAGKHLWCDKPFATTWCDWQDLLERARSAGLGAFEGMMFPYHAQFHSIQRHLACGTIGALRRLTARFGFPHLKPDNFRYRRADGGGALLDAAGYPAAAARVLLGPIAQVHGIVESEPGMDVDTSGSALLRAASGAHAVLEWGFGFAYRNEIELWGDGGILLAERAFSKPSDLETVVRIRLATGETREERIPPCNHFTLMFDAFARAIQTGDLEPCRRAAWEQGELLARIGLP